MSTTSANSMNSFMEISNLISEIYVRKVPRNRNVTSLEPKLESANSLHLKEIILEQTAHFELATVEIAERFNASMLRYI